MIATNVLFTFITLKSFSLQYCRLKHEELKVGELIGITEGVAAQVAMASPKVGVAGGTVYPTLCNHCAVPSTHLIYMILLNTPLTESVINIMNINNIYC